jgi:hypothetical protein
MRALMSFLAIVVLVGTASALSTRSEARLSFRNADQMRAQLAGLLGDLDICSHGSLPFGGCYLMVFADAAQLDALRARAVEVEVTWKDIRDKFRAMTGSEPGDPTGRDFGYYFNYWEMRDTLTRLATLYPAITKIDTSMRTYQNRALWCLKISDNPDTNENEPQVFFNGATHAREPMGTHTCISFASLVCQNYGQDSLATWLVNNREIYIVPVMNPDGYVYNSDSGGSSSYWRKNRHVVVPPDTGIDLNRNYGFKWGYDDNGSSPYPGSEVYRGPARWSEPEVAAIRDFEAAHRFRTEIDFHSYARDNLYPWAYIGASPPELALIQEIGDTFMANNGYSNTGQWYSSLYPSNGTSVDWELSDTVIGSSPKFVTYALTSELGINDFWYGWDNPPYVDAEVALNVPNCWYFTRLCGVFLEPLALVVNDTTTGNGNGQLDPGETANLWFKLDNRALHLLDTAKSVTAVLVSPDTMLQVVTPSATLPALSPRRGLGDNRLSQVQVRASPNIAPGAPIDLRLEVSYTDDGVTITQPLTYHLVIGTHSGIARSPTPGPEPLSSALRATPNPAHGAVTFLCPPLPPNPQPLTPILSIYRLDGSLVRTVRVTASSIPPSVSWDCRDQNGQRVTSGVYLARLSPNQGTATVRVLLLP